MSKNNSLLYQCYSMPSPKSNGCRNNSISSTNDHALRKVYTDEEDMSSTTSTATCSLTIKNLEMHAKRLSFYKHSKYERIKSFVESITLEVMQESDVYELHEKELVDLLIYEQEPEYSEQDICLFKEKNNKKNKKNWITRLKHWIQPREEPKRRPWSWSAPTIHEKDRKKLEMINVLSSTLPVNDDDDDDNQSDNSDINIKKIKRRPSLYHPRITSVPIERQPKFSPDVSKRKCQIRTSKSSKQEE